MGGLLCPVLIVLLLALSGDSLLRPIAAWLVARDLPWDGGAVEIGGVTRHGLGGVSVTGVRLTAATDGNVLAIDTLTVRFRLGELLRGSSRRIRRVRAAGVRLDAVHSDSGWGWVRPFVDDPTLRQRWADRLRGLIIDTAVVRYAGLHAADASGTTLLTVDSVTATVAGVVLDSNPTLRLDEATALVRHPGLAAGWLRAAGSAVLTDGRVHVDSAVLHDTRDGTIVAAGVLDVRGRPEGLDVRVRGAGVHVAQLHPMLSGLVIPTQRVDFDGTFGGTAERPELDARIAFEGAGRVLAESRITHAAGATNLDLTAVMEEVDVARITGGRYAIDPVQGRVNGTLDVTAPDSMDGPVVVDVRSRAAGYPLSLSGRADFTRGEARVDMDLRSRDVTGRLRGTIRPLGVQRYDLAAVMRAYLPLPDSGATRVPQRRGPWDVEVRVRGAGFAADRAEATLRGTVAGAGGIGSGVLRGEIAHGTARLESELTLALGPWLPTDDPGRMSATLNARVTGNGISGSARIDSVVGGILAGLAAELAFNRVGRRATATGWARAGPAAAWLETIELHGTAPERGALSFTGVDPSRFLSVLRPASIDGRLQFASLGQPADTVRRPTSWRDALLAGQLTLEHSAPGRESIAAIVDLRYRRGNLQVEGALDSIRFAGMTLGRSDLSLSVIGGITAFNGTTRVGRVATTVLGDVRAADDGGWRGNGTVVLSDTGGEAAESLPVRFSVATPGARSCDGWCVALAGAGGVAGVRLDSVVADLVVDDTVLTVRRLAISGPDIMAHGNGVLPLRFGAPRRTVLTVTASSTDLGPLLAATGRRGYGGRAWFSMRSTGSGSGVGHDLTLGVQRLQSDMLEIDSAAVELSARSDASSWLVGATGSVDISGRRPLMISHATLPMLAGLGNPGDSQLTRVHAGGEWTATDGALRVLAFQTQLGGETWELERPARISLGDVIAVEHLVVSSPTGRAAVTGRLDPHADQDLTVDIVRLPVQLRHRDAAAALAGRVDLTMRVSGSAAAPHVTLDGRLHDATDRIDGVGIVGDWTNRRLELRMVREGTAQGEIDVSGTLPFGLSLAGRTPSVELTDDSLDLRMDVAGLDLARVGFPLDPRHFASLRGRVWTDVRVSGLPTSPRLTGEVSLDGFGLVLPALGTELSAQRLTGSFAGQRFTIGDATVRGKGGGSVRLSGGVAFPELRRGVIDIAATLDRFRAVDNRKLETTVSGRLAVRGTLDAPEVSGEVYADDAIYHASLDDLPGEYARIRLTEEDYQEVERRFGVRRASTPFAASRLWHASAVDVTMHARSNVWVRRTFEPALAVEVVGAVRGQKPPNGQILAEGEMRVVEGRSSVQEFGRHFTITRGVVRFDGPITGAELDGQAVYRPDDDVTIQLTVAGNLDGLSLTLSSEPQMDETDIVWYLAVGRPATDASRFGDNGGLAASGAAFALSRIGAGVQDVARQSLGLDVAEVRQDGLRGLTLVAGRHMTPRLYIGFEQPVSFQGRQSSRAGLNDTEVEAEYRATKWLLMNLSGSRSLARFFLTTRHAY